MSAPFEYCPSRHTLKIVEVLWQPTIFPSFSRLQAGKNFFLNTFPLQIQLSQRSIVIVMIPYILSNKISFSTWTSNFYKTLQTTYQTSKTFPVWLSTLPFPNSLLLPATNLNSFPSYLFEILLPSKLQYFPLFPLTVILSLHSAVPRPLSLFHLSQK